MNILDNLVALIDNGGTRDAAERRDKLPDEHLGRRSAHDRRSGADRRRIPNDKRKQGTERRTVFFKKVH